MIESPGRVIDGPGRRFSACKTPNYTDAPADQQPPPEGSRVPRIPRWRLPRGVDRALVEYTSDEQIADEYDDTLGDSGVSRFDAEYLARRLTTPGVVVDLGAGTGRSLFPLARRGFRCVAVDLSLAMLRVVNRKAQQEGLAIDRVRANIVELDGLRDGVADDCLLLYSTLGMIRGADNRLAVLGHARRILRPGGHLIVHAHNRWQNLYTCEGRRWLATNWLKRVAGATLESGGQPFHYRGIANLLIHSFTRRELVSLIRHAGFRLVELTSLDTQRQGTLRAPWWFGSLRADGWLAWCRRDA